jgi:hypothetical protein
MFHRIGPILFSTLDLVEAGVQPLNEDVKNPFNANVANKRRNNQTNEIICNSDNVLIRPDNNNVIEFRLFPAIKYRPFT